MGYIRSVLKPLIASVATAAALIVGTEYLLRVSDVRVMRYERITGGFVAEPWGGRYAANATIVRNFGNHRATVVTDADGLTFRRRSGPNPSRILFIGDSATAGSEEGSYVRAFYDHAAATGRRALEVINGGVEGYNGREILGWFDSVGRRFSPDIVVYGFTFNDVLGYDNAANWRISSGKPGLRIISPRVEDIRYRYGLFIPVPFRTAAFVKANSLSYGLLNRLVYPPQPYGLAAAHAWVVERAPGLGGKERADLEDYLARLRGIIAAQRARDGRFAIALIPDGSEVDRNRVEGRYFHELKAFCAGRAIHCIDLLPALRAAHAKGRKVYWNFRDDADAHMTPAGYDIAGRAIASYMRQTDFLVRAPTPPTAPAASAGRARPWRVTASPYGSAAVAESAAGISVVVDRPPGGFSLALPVAAGEDAELSLDAHADGPVTIRFRDGESLVYLHARSGAASYLLKPAHDNPELLVYADRPARFGLRAASLTRGDGRVFAAEWRDAPGAAIAVLEPSALTPGKSAADDRWRAGTGETVLSVDGGAVALTSDRSRYHYQLVSPAIAVTPGRDYLVRHRITVEQGRVAVGVLDARANRWIAVRSVVGDGAPSSFGVRAMADRVRLIVANDNAEPAVTHAVIRALSLHPVGGAP